MHSHMSLVHGNVELAECEPVVAGRHKVGVLGNTKFLNMCFAKHNKVVKYGMHQEHGDIGMSGQLVGRCSLNADAAGKNSMYLTKLNHFRDKIVHSKKRPPSVSKNLGDGRSLLTGQLQQQQQKQQQQQQQQCWV